MLFAYNKINLHEIYNLISFVKGNHHDYDENIPITLKVSPTFTGNG